MKKSMDNHRTTMLLPVSGGGDDDDKIIKETETDMMENNVSNIVQEARSDRMHKTYIWDMTQLGADGDSAPWDHCHSCWLPAWASA
eukprot:scaffold48719_cov76-Attheya_sp.AAC.1